MTIVTPVLYDVLAEREGEPRLRADALTELRERVGDVTWLLDEFSLEVFVRPIPFAVATQMGTIGVPLLRGEDLEALTARAKRGEHEPEGRWWEFWETDQDTPRPISDLSDTLSDMSRMSATEAARSFSDVLNRVAAGDEVEVTRSGAPVAIIGPPTARLVSAERFRELVATAPRPDEDFARDVRAARASVGPPDAPWRS